MCGVLKEASLKEVMSPCSQEQLWSNQNHDAFWQMTQLVGEKPEEQRGCAHGPKVTSEKSKLILVNMYRGYFRLTQVSL